MPTKVKSINRKAPVGPYRAKHIFLEEREAEAAQEFREEKAEHTERLIAHHDRRKRSRRKPS